ncbi:MAG: hypothetical protein P4M11_04665 [Candidatus Pacebacteria bacterium]|nr:hypothetical protein [Candidatus Paceibacterota bacterium]
MSYGYYSQVSVCATNTALSMCQYINKMLDYSFQLAFTPMRNKEDEISTRLQKELNSLATDDETTQYVLVGVCIALVAISAGVITPIFIKVIRDKSYVFAIFSHIQPEEIRIVIKECKKLDVKRVRFKKAWVSEYADQQEVFWRKVRAGNRVSGALQLHNHGASRDSGLLADKSDAGKGMPSQGVGESDMGLVQTHQNNTKANGKSPAKKPPNKWEEDKEEDEEGSQGAEQRDKAEFDRAEKERKRVDLLSATDYDLRNKSILRLVFSFILFLAYGGISIYFNHYVHSVNSEAVSMFFVYHNRAIYAASAALFLKEAITTGNKVLVSKNSGTEPPAQLLGNDGKMYLMDVIDNLHTIEKEVSDFSKRASESIYGNFLALQRRAESSEFCAVSDSYNYSQTLRTNRIFTVLVACSDLYTGPGQQGVSAGMSYLIDFYTQYAVKVTNADYTNATVAATMKNDQNPTLFSMVSKENERR